MIISAWWLFFTILQLTKI